MKTKTKYLRFRNGSKIKMWSSPSMALGCGLGGKTIVDATGPLQTCADLPKKKARREKAQKTQEGKLVVVLVTTEDIEAVHRFLQFYSHPGHGATGRVVPLMQGIARGWLIG